MKEEFDIFKHFSCWAQNNENIRAAILTSSRVHPYRVIDDLSDYDIELYVSNIAPFQDNDDWLNTFGSVLMRWPRRPELGSHDDHHVTRMVIFDNDVRFDFQLTDQLQIASNAYPNGYRVLIDKDNLTAHLKEPTYDVFHSRAPTLDEFEYTVCGFFWDADYVAKHLYRDELPFAKIMFNEIRQEYLYKVIDWYIGMNNDWMIDTGKGGRWFKYYLDKSTWQNFEQCFAGGDIEDNWHAFFYTIKLFDSISRRISAYLDLDYPDQISQKATKRFQRIYNGQ